MSWANQLKTQKYKDAAEKLRQMQLRSKKQEQDFEEKQKRLKKLKSAAKRMASASRASRDKRGEGSEALSGLLEMEKLESQAYKLGHEMDSTKSSKDLLDQMDMIDLELDRLSDRLRQMDAKKQLQGKLKLLGMPLSKRRRDTSLKTCRRLSRR